MSETYQESYPMRDAIYGLMDTIRYLDDIGRSLCNDYTEFEHNEQYDNTFSLILDLLGVPKDTYDHEKDTGFSRDWIYPKWFENTMSNDEFVEWLGQEFDLMNGPTDGLIN